MSAAIAGAVDRLVPLRPSSCGGYSLKLFVFHTPELTPAITDASGPDCAIAIDVLRATTTMAAALNNGAEAVQAFSDLNVLLETSDAWPADRRIRIGERGGKMMAGCDLGNSPLDCTADRVGGARLFMSTTNGTRALERIAAAKTVLTAALTNRQAVVDALLDMRPDKVWMTGSGWEGSFALEDTVAAGAIAAALVPHLNQDWAGNDEAIAALALFEQWSNRLPDLMRAASHGQRLLRLGNTADLDYCAQLDIVSTVPMQGQVGVLAAR